ncbi:hypothetical protein Val02_24090 [Virgisporangium aliadipatigenens]|uniref:Uncharacterized protein n=1 Tax=Virgisporangium aliadipatigenens TaxID=741659 RepID=A0A8J4DQA8_9ACTN|nr:hypothetical protein [Virgisporangium aliadipatigenens]GIJ45523.1 hypothetical protein Val02_24090 [Virgisporangium aliadipatigenens]
MLGGLLAKSLAAKVALGVVGLTGGVGAVAAETGALPAPVQNVAHDVAGGLGVPKKVEDRPGQKPGGEKSAAPKPSTAKESPRPSQVAAIPSGHAVPSADGAVPSASGRPEDNRKSPAPGLTHSPGDDKGRHGEVKPSTKPTPKPAESKSPKESPKPSKTEKSKDKEKEKPKPSTSKTHAE